MTSFFIMDDMSASIVSLLFIFTEEHISSDKYPRGESVHIHTQWLNKKMKITNGDQCHNSYKQKNLNMFEINDSFTIKIKPCF